MGGHAIYYPLSDSPMGKKESVADTSKVLSRMVNIICARLNSRLEMRELAENSSVPVINILDDFAHPCQMLSDILV
jgi:ornithine carbamoyltransferase